MSERCGGRGTATWPEDRPGGLEHVIEGALEPGYFVSYRRSFDFVRELEEVREWIVALFDGGDIGDAARAVSLLELFIAGCYEKSEEIDDSGGTFGDFVGDLFCDWIRAKQAAGADPDDTARLLLSWMENDDYGYCYRIEERVVKAFESAGLHSFEAALRGRWDSEDREDPQRRRTVEILKAIQVERGDPDAYAALCEEQRDLVPKDCEEVAGLLLQVGRVEEALEWAERGIEMQATEKWPNRSAWDLPRLRRRILLELDRDDEALASAWEDFRRSPSTVTYADLMELVPQEGRVEWRARALDEAEEADPRLRIDLFVETSEVERLARTVESVSDEDLLAVTHYTLEPAAESLLPSRPLLAAKLHRIMALRIMDEAKSRYYSAALDHLERVRQILLEQGSAREWQGLVEEIRTRHRRKSRFMPGFERLAAGEPWSGPSFLDRARTRWHRGVGEGDEAT